MNKNLTLEDLKYKSSLIGSYEFYFGNLYFLHCQENGVPHCLMRLIVGLSSVCSGNLFLNGKLLDTKQKTQLSCYVGGNMQYTWYRRPMTVHSQLKKGLANLKNQYSLFSIDQCINAFNLTRERLDRPLSSYSGERYRAGMAIGSVQGKQLFCFPWFDQDDIRTKWRGIKRCIDFLTAHNALVILPIAINHIRDLESDTRFEGVKILAEQSDLSNLGRQESLRLDWAIKELKNKKMYPLAPLEFEDHSRNINFFHPYHWVKDSDDTQDINSHTFPCVELVAAYSFIKMDVYYWNLDRTTTQEELRAWVCEKLTFYVHGNMKIKDERIEEIHNSEVTMIKRSYIVQNSVNYQIGFLRTNDMVVFHLHCETTFEPFCLPEFEELIDSFNPKR